MVRYDPKKKDNDSILSRARKQSQNEIKKNENFQDYSNALQQKEELRDKYVRSYLEKNKLAYNDKNIDLADFSFENEFKNNYDNLYNELSGYQKEYAESKPEYHLVDTILDLGIHTGKGFLNTVEGVVDAGRMLTSDIANFIVGENDFSKWLKERAEQDSTGALFGTNDDLAIKGWTNGIEKHSISNDFIDSVFEGVGNIAAFAGFGGIGGAVGATSNTGQLLTSAGASFTSSWGNTYTELKRQGIDDSTARKNAFVNALAETASEQFFDKIPGITSAGWGDKLSGKLTNAAEHFFGTKSGKIVSTILDGVSEGSEEIISNMIQQFGNDVLYLIDESYTYDIDNSLLANGYQFGDLTNDVLSQLTTPESLQSFMSASISSFLVNSGKGVVSDRQKNQIINAYAKDNGMSFKEAKAFLTSQTETAKSEINRDKTEYNSNVELRDMAENRVLNYMNQTTSQNIDNQINQMEKVFEKENNRKFTEQERKEVFDYLKNKTEDQINSPKRYRSFSLENEPTNSKEKTLYDTFVKNANDTKTAHDLYDYYKSLQKQNKNANYHLTSNEELTEMGLLEKKNGEYGRTITKDGKKVFVKETPNGINLGDRILINKDGLNAFEATTWHEIGHSIKDSSPEGYNDLKNIVKEVFGEDDFKKYESRYKNLYGDNELLEDEYINDKLGEMLNNETFMNKITGNRNLIQIIIDKIKNMVKYVTSNSDKKKLMKIQEQLENKALELYKENNFIESNGAAYSVIGETGFNNIREYINNGIDVDEKSKRLINTLSTSLQFAKMRYRDGFDRTKIYGETFWYNDKGKWKLELSNHDLEIQIPKKLKMNQTISLGKILGNDILTIAYPELNDVKFVIKDMDKKGIVKIIAELNGKKVINTATKGFYNSNTNTISLNKYIAFSKKAKSTLIHEIQHVIQKIEGFEKGTNVSLSRLRYAESNGEAEARTASNRMNIPQEELKNNLPFYEEQEINRQNKIYNYLNKTDKGLIDKIKDAIYTKIKREANNESVELDEEENNEITKSIIQRDRKYNGQQENGLNSSFSLSSNEHAPLKTNGTYTEDITDNRPIRSEYNLPSKEDINVSYNKNYGVLTEEDYKNKGKELVDRYIDKTANKIDEQVKEIAKRNLELRSKDIASLKAITDKYSGLSREDIFSSNAKEDIRKFVNEHSHQQYEEEIYNKEIRDLQKEIRSREFIISNDYKGEFPDGLTKFKKNNPGINIKFGKNGNLDTQLQEIASLFPGHINENASIGDIPYVLADILKNNYKQVKLQQYNLSENEIDDITNKIFFGLTNNAISERDLNNYVTTIQDKIRNKYARQMAVKEYREQAKEMIDDISQIHDKKRGIQYQVNTMKRNLRDIMSQEQAQKMYDVYFKPIHIHNAQSETDINDYNDRINSFNLTNEESTYTQMLGELKYNTSTTLTEQVVNDYLEKHRSKIDTKKVNSAVEEFRNIYDELYDRINETYIANGYKPLDYHKGYFPHYIEEKADTVLGKFAKKLGFDVKKGQLPTDIAGISDEFLPGRAWASFSQQRTGDATDYNALKGMDNYLRAAMDIIYHTQDIQRLRALEAEIRYQYSDKGIQEKLDAIYNDQSLSSEDKYAQAALITDNVKNNPLGNFATELRNYTNNLANKKAIGDRGMEQSIGRDMYSIMNNVSGRVSANMVGANISSAMTNFIPITQAWSQVSTKNMLRGIYSTIKSCIRDDGFSLNSIYLTNRTKQADRLYKTKLEKFNQKLGIPFEAIDSFTSNVIVRSKYLENIDKGMNEVDAMDNADEFAKDVMAGRSKGDSPTVFNKKNPLAKLFTAFQLEVNNQYGYMLKDIKADIGGEAKDKLAKAFFKMFLGAFLYNAITEQITGRKSAFSPIDMAIEDAKVITNDNLDLGSKIQNIANNTAQEAPFLGGVLGGGRLPIQAAIPYDNPLSMVLSSGENIANIFDDEKRDKAIKSLLKEWSKPVYYVGLPFAGGQIKKTNEGIAMYNHDLPGSYTDSGRLRFEADTSMLGRLQAYVFGQYASANAREYFDEGYSPLTEKQLNEALSVNLPINEYREVNKGIAKAKQQAKEDKESQSEAMYDYIYNLPISMEQKNTLLNSRLGTSDNVVDDNGYIKYTDGTHTYWYDEKKNIVYNSKYREMPNISVKKLTKYSNVKDISNYGDYGSLEEFNYAAKNPTKYSISKLISSYDKYVQYKDDISAIKDNYNDNTTLGRKKAQQEVFKYINALPLNQYQKLMLQKMAGGYSIKSYQNAMFEYINGLDLTKQEKQNIHKELFE